MDKCKNWTEDCEMWVGCPCVYYEHRNEQNKISSEVDKVIYVPDICVGKLKEQSN